MVGKETSGRFHERGRVSQCPMSQTGSESFPEFSALSNYSALASQAAVPVNLVLNRE